MFVEFFIKGESRRFAWLGLLIFLGKHAFDAWISIRLNLFYKDFYDVLGSHFQGERDRVALLEAVRSQLVTFIQIVSPIVIVAPLTTFLRQRWLLAWRLCLVTSYLDRWPRTHLEGAAQRVHEDAFRFVRGVEGAVSIAITSTLTIATFSSVLARLDIGLFFIALATALGGLFVSAVVGSPLVDLEVENQRTEAQLRTLLEHKAAATEESGTAEVALALTSLSGNYKRLYRCFCVLNIWLSSYDQIGLILPYLVCAQRLFARTDPITIGTLTQISNSFGKIFGSLSVLSDHWLDINEFRSVLRRLKQFESVLVPRQDEPPNEVRASHSL